MKILVVSYAFLPGVGGIEHVSSILCREFHNLGHQVVVITETPNSSHTAFPYTVIRNPDVQTCFRLLKWADVCWENNFSLRLGWPFLILRKKNMVVTLATFFGGEPKLEGWRWMLRRWLIRQTAPVLICRAMLEQFPSGRIIYNPYNADLFYKRAEVVRNKTLLFVGRLVSDKGVVDLIDALSFLASKGLRPDLTIVGDGPDRERLLELVETRNLVDKIEFLGQLEGEKLAEQFNRHKILVVPSRWREPFGIVALEGLASGCRLVVSKRGGLVDAVGIFGVLFENGDPRSLSEALITSLGKTSELAENAGLKNFLKQFQPKTVALKYLAYFQEVLATREK